MITLLNIQAALYELRRYDAIAHRPLQWRIQINPTALEQAMRDAGVLSPDDALAPDPDVTLFGALVDLDDRLPSNEFHIALQFDDAGLSV